MRLRLSLFLLGPAAIAGLAACGGSGSSGPQILVFKGPSAVSCAKQGQTKTVPYVYKTKNATAVEPEVDGQSPGAQAGYPPNGGTMRFPYICDGPHKFTITASDNKGKSVSKSVTVEPSSGG
jgi:hypothetical protein